MSANPWPDRIINMGNRKENMMSNQNEKTVGSGIIRPGARPMSIHIDDQGNEWLCDKHINGGDFASQGCWRTDRMAFNRND